MEVGCFGFSPGPGTEQDRPRSGLQQRGMISRTASSALTRLHSSVVLRPSCPEGVEVLQTGLVLFLHSRVRVDQIVAPRRITLRSALVSDVRMSLFWVIEPR